MNKSILSVLFMLSILSCKENFEKLSSASSQEREKIVNHEWVDQKIDSAMKANNIPALSIGIISNGELVYAKGFGYLNREGMVGVDENTLYQIGSDTKKFTAIIVNNLSIEGKMDLNEPFTSYLPNSLTDKTKKKLGKITLEKLLLHTSGIPNRAPSNSRIDGDPMLIEYTEVDLLNDLNSLELDFEPGTKFSYSNFGYAIAGYVCEKVSDQDYSSLVKKYISDKYAMPNTTIFPSLEQKSMVANPYRKDDRNLRSEPWIMGKIAPAGGIYSNVEDISKLMIAQLKAYKIFQETGDKNSPLILTENSNNDGEHYGFGLAKRIDKNGIRYGHGGDLDGFASGYVFSHEYNVGVILLTSSGGQWFSELDENIRKTLIDKVRIKTAKKNSKIEK